MQDELELLRRQESAPHVRLDAVLPPRRVARAPLTVLNAETQVVRWRVLAPYQPTRYARPALVLRLAQATERLSTQLETGQQ